MKKLTFLLATLNVLSISIVTINCSYIHSAEKNVAESWIKAINAVDLTNGIGKAISNAIDANILLKAETLGAESKNYWAYRAINKKLIEAKDPVAIKWAPSINLLKKIVVSVFYRPQKLREVDDFLEGQLQNISEIINACHLNKIDWYSDEITKQQILGLLNGIFVLLALDLNIHDIVANSVKSHNSVTNMLNKHSSFYKKGIFESVCAYMKDIEIKSNNKNLYNEIISKFDNKKENFWQMIVHDVQCYLEQFGVITHTDFSDRIGNNIVCSSAIGKYVYTCYWKETWLSSNCGRNIIDKNSSLSLLKKTIIHFPAYQVLGKLLNDWRQHEVYKVCNDGLEIWINGKKKILETILQKYNEYIKNTWYSEFKKCIEIDYNNYDFLLFLDEFMKYDTKSDKTCEIFTQNACHLLQDLCIEIYDFSLKKNIQPILSASNLRHITPINILYIVATVYQHLISVIRNEINKNFQFNESLMHNIFIQSNNIIRAIFEYIKNYGIINVDKKDISDLGKILVNKFYKRILNHSMINIKVSGLISAYEYEKEIAIMLSNINEKDFSKIVKML